MLVSFKKVRICSITIDEGKEISAQIKVPEFIDLRTRPFCSEDHPAIINCMSKTPLAEVTV